MVDIFLIEAQEIFKNRLNILKTAHELNNATLATLLDFKSGASILHMENGKLKPSVDALLRIVDLFAVNIDWIYGRVNHIYNDIVISKLEKELFEIEVLPDLPFYNSDANTRNYCSDIEFRKKDFTLAERANIIFLLQYLKVLNQKGTTVMEEGYRLGWSKEAIKNVLAGRTKRMRFSDEVSERSYIMRNIFYILANDFRMMYQDPGTPEVTRAWAKEQIKPLYDVEKVLYLQQIN